MNSIFVSDADVARVFTMQDAIVAMHAVFLVALAPSVHSELPR